MPVLHATARGPVRFGRNLLLLVEAGALLTAASVAIRWLPFRRVLIMAGWRGGARAPADRVAAARRLRWAVDYAADRAPWRAVCFQRGLTLQWMARRRGLPTMFHYGIDPRDAGGLSAHVWIELDGQPLIGGDGAARHARVLVLPASVAADA